ncbi:hypothetical protein E4U60_005623 [Claviceps pazoutovae]|uniref:Uncharacterized protein n=1 Tax=Claviceps pazoutovae TaxID=1649127 RepID=A0A9P7MGU5_9HYPO|nr:hypothetical protein E4U60_005623 [Claviceps pazoutovae]
MLRSRDRQSHGYEGLRHQDLHRFYALDAGQKSLWCPSSRPSSSLDDSTRNLNQDAGTPPRSRNAAYAMRTMTSLRDSSRPFSNSNHNSHAVGG